MRHFPSLCFGTLTRSSHHTRVGLARQIFDRAENRSPQFVAIISRGRVSQGSPTVHMPLLTCLHKRWHRSCSRRQHVAAAYIPPAVCSMLPHQVFPLMYVRTCKRFQDLSIGQNLKEVIQYSPFCALAGMHNAINAPCEDLCARLQSAWDHDPVSRSHRNLR